MSFDLGVWYMSVAMSQRQAADYYQHMGSDWVFVERNSQFDSFLKDLTEQLPDLRSPSDPPVSPDTVSPALLQTIDDLKALPPPSDAQLNSFREKAPIPETSPWADTMSPSGSTIQLTIGWSFVEKTVPLVYRLAEQHGLTIFDPQSGTVAVPKNVEIKSDPDLLKVHLSMRINGKPPALDVVFVVDGKPDPHASFRSRLAAHEAARKLAVSRHLRFYEVVDPQCLAQAMRLVTIQSGSKDYPPMPSDAKGVIVKKLVLPGVND